MAHLPTLVSDLALILITAGIVTILFKWLKQPVVLGYIVAGFLISPHFVLLPSVADVENISTWGEIGIIFLLFALGLEFSFKKLMDVGGTAAIATFINMGSMIAIGYLIGNAMGWTQMESIFLGGMLSMSSTTIIIKAFNDMGLQKKKFAGIVFGMLIVEDLAAIMMMVILSTFAISRHFSGAEFAGSILKLVFFVVIWFVVGIYLLPGLLRKLKKFLNNETLLVLSVGLCLGMVLFATKVGFSAALGAFIMGSILAETVESHRIEHLMEPLKNLFGAVFFVSVGMMIVPEIIVQYIGPILILTVVVLVGRVVFATLGVLASGQGLKVSLQAGFSLAQIGEFSFIIATLGMQLGVIGDFLYPIIVAVSVITTFTTPYFIKLSQPLASSLEKHIPPKWDKLIHGYASYKSRNIQHKSDWQKVLKGVFTTVFIYTVLAFGVFLLSRLMLIPFITDRIPGLWGSLLSAVITLGMMAPFIVGVISRRKNVKPELFRLWNDKHFNKGILISLNLFRVAVGIGLILMVLLPLFSQATGILLLSSFIILSALVFVEGFRKRPAKMEEKFFRNLNEKEITEESRKAINKQVTKDLLDKNIHVEEFEVAQNSVITGKTLGELDFKKRTGVNVISIIRGDQKINIPDSEERVYPFDRLIVVGSDNEIQRFMQDIDKIRDIGNLPTDTRHQICLSQYHINENSLLMNRSVSELRIREKANCMIVCIERNNSIISEIKAETILQQEDVLYLAGEKNNLTGFEENLFI